MPINSAFAEIVSLIKSLIENREWCKNQHSYPVFIASTASRSCSKSLWVYTFSLISCPLCPMSLYLVTLSTPASSSSILKVWRQSWGVCSVWMPQDCRAALKNSHQNEVLVVYCQVFYRRPYPAYLLSVQKPDAGKCCN